MTTEEKAKFAIEKKILQEELAKNREKYLAQGKEILGELKGRKNRDIRSRMVDNEIPMTIINELAPEEKDEKK